MIKGGAQFDWCTYSLAFANTGVKVYVAQSRPCTNGTPSAVAERV